MLGVVQFRLQNYRESAASLEKALQLNVSHADSNFWLAKIHLLKGEQKQALECLERTVKLEPKHLGAYYQLGLLYARNGEKEKSKDAMEMQRQLNAQMHKGLVALRMP
jgi:tetratricopeptide (TPR) repeat protein